MNRKTVTVIVVLVLVFIVLPVFVATAIGVGLLIGRGTHFPGGGEHVALIRVEGIITSGRGSSGFLSGSSAGAERIIDLLEQFRKDNSVRSGVLRINSPGGSAAGSQEIYQEIRKVRREGKRLTVSMGDVAASGGYYIACGANRIYADQATMTGSIGVILQTSDMHELFSHIGIKFGTVKTGPYKDIGSNSRPMTPAEKQLLQNLVNDVYDQFLDDVSAGRRLPKPEVRKLADGRVFTGRQALRLKLVDRIGSLQDAEKAAARDAGIRGEFEVIEYEHEKGLLDILMGDTESSLSDWLSHAGLLSGVAERALVGGQGLVPR